jgi:pimeloyl-ACP methyl ester carboxylesterase
VIRRVVIGAIVLIVVLLIAGSIYQRIAGNVPDGRYAPTGQLVDIGGRVLHIHCTGQGTPTVLLDAGLGLGAVTWQHVQPALSAITRVCSYDRAGYGWSSTGPSPRTAARVTGDLHVLLERAGIQGPLVMAGHSLGGLFIRHYAATYPADVAGMVLVDSTHEDQDAPPAAIRLMVSVLGRAGVTRALFQFDDPGLNAMYKSNRSLGATIEEFAAVEESENQTRQAHLSLGDKPLVVITSGSNDSDPTWHRLQTELVSRSSAAKHIIATGSGHYVQDDRPQLVIDAIRDVVAATRQTRS